MKYILIGCTIIFCSCATMKESILLGVGTGAISGAVIGSSVRNGSPEGAWTGAVIGGLVGGIAGYAINKGLEDRDNKTRKDTLFNLERYSVTRPTSQPAQGANLNYTISAPNVETECFETQVKAGKLVQAHCESTIVGQPEWVEGSKPQKKANQ